MIVQATMFPDTVIHSTHFLESEDIYQSQVLQEFNPSYGMHNHILAMILCKKPERNPKILSFTDLKAISI